MKINIKIDPYNYPIIIIGAFVIGLVLAIALGFGPQHGSGEQGHQFVLLPVMLQSLPLVNGKVQ